MKLQQLQLDFENAKVEFDRASQNLMKKAKALTNYDPDQRKVVKSELSDKRRLFNRLVRLYAYGRCDQNFAQAYTQVYGQIQKVMNYHPMDDLQKCGETMLDYLEQKGFMDVALTAVRDLNKRGLKTN